MQTILLGLILFMLATLGLGLGAILRRPPIKGSCGGLACANACHACPRRAAGAHSQRQEGRAP
ncbi:hypothetical protein [Pseudogemmobacter sonorensis]|uniref:hypothetical protein n=1 Tax=Pseudogemmobacter sonorensis TaxID=2989681 RepID=UPI00369D797C